MYYLHPQLFIKPEMKPTRDGFGKGLLELGTVNKDVVVLTADVSDSVRVAEFGKQFPDRYFQCGVSEQNMMAVACGFAQEGKIPFLSSYATFSPGRSWDQLRVSGCYSNVPVKVAGAHTGISVGPDGATHQALEDIASIRVLPNITVVVPCDAEETRKATIAIAALQGPAYIRFAREKTPIMTIAKTSFKIGRAEVARKGKNVTIVACGPLLYEALVAARMLAKLHISAEVINCHTIKPLDTHALLVSFKKTRAVVTVEEHQITGGLGGAVSEFAGQKFPVPIERIGMLDTFGESGEADELLVKYCMKAHNVVKAVQKVLKRKK